MPRTQFVSLMILAALVAACEAPRQESQPTQRSSSDWLLDAESDEARFGLLQTQMRGFDQPMWEVGERFEGMHDALERGNSELATYHWDKIKTTIENGIAKRPARRANAEALFLTGTWDNVRADLASADPDQSWAAFDQAKTACQSCHQAENVDYMNDQPVFDLARPATRAER